MEREQVIFAQKVRYENGMIYILLSDNREVNFSVYLNEKLRKASSEQVANIEIICGGTGLNWPDLDEDLSVVGIMEGRFGKV